MLEIGIKSNAFFKGEAVWYFCEDMHVFFAKCYAGTRDLPQVMTE